MGSKGGHYCSTHHFKQAHRDHRQGELGCTGWTDISSERAAPPQISAVQLLWATCLHIQTFWGSWRIMWNFRHCVFVELWRNLWLVQCLSLVALTQTHQATKRAEAPLKCHSYSEAALSDGSTSYDHADPWPLGSFAFTAISSSETNSSSP